MPAVKTATRLSQFQISDFSGGLNLRSSEVELALNESPSCMNITLDERGGVVKRLGLTRFGDELATGANALFYSAALDDFFIQDGAVLKKTDNFTSLTNVNTFTSAARCAMVDFKTLLVVVHPVDGVYTYDGASFTNRSTTVKGDAIAAWQNKVWVGGDTSQRPRVWWSNAGDATVWTTASDFVDLREVDDQIITGLGVGQDMDVAGRPGLLVTKEHSFYRINSSTTGSYTTLGTEAGASSHLAIASVGGLTATMNRHGIWLTNGTAAPVLASSKLSPLFTASQLSLANMGKAAAAPYGDRLLFSLPRTGSSLPNLTLEYHPRDGWIVPHSFGLNCYTTFNKNDDFLVGAGALNGTDYFAFKVFQGGADDGEAIMSRYQTRWIELAAENRVRLRRLLISGRGTFDMYVRKDFQLAAGVLFPVVSQSIGAVWNSFNWNDGSLWGPTLYEEQYALYSLGHARAFSFRFQHTGTTSATSPALLGTGAGQEVGAFAVYSALADFVNLGAN